MAGLELTPQVFAIIMSLVEERAGLHYSLLDAALVADKVKPRAVELGFDSLLDYYYFLRYDPGGSAELDELVDSLVVHETYFFREVEQLEVLCDGHLASLVARGMRPRVWCAACATGEEPYTLAMLLQARGLLPSVDLVASDVSVRALERARRAEYSGRAFRATDPHALEEHFEPRGMLRVPRAPLRDAVTWRRVNIVDTAQVRALGRFDAILCRNLLIYFADATAQRVVASLGEALWPGGRLLVGASESLLRLGTSLRFEERGGSFFYEKLQTEKGK